MERSSIGIYNLKADFEKNFIDKDVWIPELVFGNQKEHTLEYKEKLKKREGKGKLNKYDDVNMKEIFESYGLWKLHYP